MKKSHREEIDTQKRNSATVSSQRPSEYGPSVDGQRAEGDKTLSAFLFSCEQETSISIRYPAFDLGTVLGGLCNSGGFGEVAPLKRFLKLFHTHFCLLLGLNELQNNGGCGGSLERFKEVVP